MGSRTYAKLQHFRRFTINVEATSDPGNLSPQRVGSFQLFGDSISKFNEAYLMWTAPPPGSGCVTFKAMVLEDSTHWYADEGNLSKTFCEQTEQDVKFDENNDCCACDEAKYNVGTKSSVQRPKYVFVDDL